LPDFTISKVYEVLHNWWMHYCTNEKCF